jgi:hypothetical protein
VLRVLLSAGGTAGQVFTTTFNTDLIFKAFAPTSANYALNNFKLYTSPSGVAGTFTEYTKCIYSMWIIK